LLARALALAVCLAAGAALAANPASMRRLNEAIELLNAGKLAEAREVVAKLEGAALGPYERSRVEQVTASIEYAQGNLGAARTHLERARDSGGLNDAELAAVQFQIAQLYVADEKWRDGIAALEAWFAKAEEPGPAAYYLLAVAHFQLGESERALAPAQRAVELADPPNAAWLELLIALRLQREEWAQAVPLLERLLSLAPDRKSAWLQLSAAHAARGDRAGAVAPLAIARRAGLLRDSSELRRLAELAFAAGMPARGAAVLREALAANQLEHDPATERALGNAYLAARDYERALAPLERAAELAEGGDDFARLAELHAQRDEWPAASRALRQALAKGKLARPGQAELLLGVASYNQGELTAAGQAFARAQADPAVRDQAERWLRLLRSETGVTPAASH